MAGPRRMRSGFGQDISAAAKPAGSVQSIWGDSPESPGLLQYVCQPGAMVWRSPIQNVLPGAIASPSLTSSTVTLGVPDHATPADAAMRQEARRGIANSLRMGPIVPITASRCHRLPSPRSARGRPDHRLLRAGPTVKRSTPSVTWVSTDRTRHSMV